LARVYTESIYLINGYLMKTAKLFKNGESQAVRLPKEFRFEGDEVLIKKAGNAVVLLPKKKSWDSLVDSLDQFSSDFMTERGQPTKNDRRESF
jgi:antitoxin VapB